MGGLRTNGHSARCYNSRRKRLRVILEQARCHDNKYWFPRRLANDATSIKTKHILTCQWWRVNAERQPLPPIKLCPLFHATRRVASVCSSLGIVMHRRYADILANRKPSVFSEASVACTVHHTSQSQRRQKCGSRLRRKRLLVAGA